MMSLVAAFTTIIRFQKMRSWPSSTGRVLSAAPLGRFWIQLKYSYSIDGTSCEDTQLITNDSWTRALTAGDLLPLRYSSSPTRRVFVDHSENVASAMRIALYTVWIVAGAMFLSESLAALLAP